MIAIGNHVVKYWSSTQTVIALSGGEAELYAIVKATSVSLGMQGLLTDIGVSAKIRVFTDASTGKSIATRRGLGKIRHLDTSTLWVQEQVQKGAIEVSKIKNLFNSADLFTKHLNKDEILRCMESMGHVYETGRSSVAPELTTFEVQKWASAELLRLQTQEEPENDETVRTWEPPCYLLGIAPVQAPLDKPHNLQDDAKGKYELRRI